MLQLVIVLISSYGHFQHNSLTLEQIQPVVGAQIASVVQQDAVPIKRDSVLRNRLAIMAISCMSSARWRE